MSKNITLIPKYYLPTMGGLQNHTTRLAQAFQEISYAVRIITPEPTPDVRTVDCTLPDGIEVSYLSSDRQRFWQETQALFQTGPSFKVCLAMGLEYDQNLDQQVSTLLNIKKLGTSVGLYVATTHDLSERLTPMRASRLAHLDFLIVPNKAIIEETANYPELQAKTHFLRNPIDTRKYSPASIKTQTQLRNEFGLPLNRTIVLWSGRFCERKNLMHLLEQWGTIASGSALLWLVGNDETPDQRHVTQLTQYVRQNHSNSVLISEAYPEARMPSAYRCADVFVLPSVREGMSNSLLEATSAGLSIVAFNIPGVTEVAVEFAEEGFFLAEVHDSHGLARKLEQCLLALPNTLGILRIARETNLAKFGPKMVAHSFLNLLCQ